MAPRKYNKRELVVEIINLMKEGKSTRQIAKELGISPSTVSRWVTGERAKNNPALVADEFICPSCTQIRKFWVRCDLCKSLICIQCIYFVNHPDGEISTFCKKCLKLYQDGYFDS